MMEATHHGGGLGAVVMMIVMLGLYFIPAFVAGARKHNNALAIIVLNLLLGWTFLGWVIALIWSCTNNVSKTEKIEVTKEPEEK